MDDGYKVENDTFFKYLISVQTKLKKDDKLITFQNRITDKNPKGKTEKFNYSALFRLCSTKEAIKDITEADIWIIGTPIYNSFFSSALKNLFEYIDYKKTAGKVAGLVIVAAGNQGFTDVQTLLTQLMSYFNVITNPRSVFIMADTAEDDQIAVEDVKARLKQLVDETLKLASKVS